MDNVQNLDTDSGSQPQSRTAVCEDSKKKKVSKRLAYLLRYGAEKEGLHVQEGGYVDILELVRCPLMKSHTPYELLKLTQDSISCTGRQRFERKNENGHIYIRAIYGRRMERNPHHEGTQVPRLLESCLNHVADNLNDFDLQDFPDEFLLNTLIHKLRRKQKLTTKAFRVILGPSIEHLDLGSVFLTETTIKLVAQRCPHLKVLSLRESGYAVNDHYMESMLKKLVELESLNLSGCSHLTDRTLNAIVKHCPQMQQLNLNHIPAISEAAILNLVFFLVKLSHLDVFDNENISAQGREVLHEFATSRKVTVILDGLETQEEEPQKGSLSLSLASTGKYW